MVKTTTTLIEKYGLYIPGYYSDLDFLLNVVIEQDFRVNAVVRLRE